MSGNQPKPGSRDAIVAADVEAEPVEWLWKERIPRGAISVVAGKPDQGKGLFASHLTAAVSNQGENVLFSAMEDDVARMSRPRLEAAGADLKRVLFWRFILPEQIRELYERIVDNDIKLVIIDPLAAHLGKGVSRTSDSIRKLTNPLSEICEQTGCAVVIIEHALKKVPRDSAPIAAIGGSGSGLSAAARMAYLWGKDPKDESIGMLAPAKWNLRERPLTMAFEFDVEELDMGEAPYLLYQQETQFDATNLLAMPRYQSAGRPPDKRAAAAEWLTNLLVGGPMKATDVYEDAKQNGRHTIKTVRRAADDMGVIRKPPGGSKNCTWELPPAVLAAIAKARKGSA